MARRHGVKKLMPIAEAKKICPDLVIADGEDLSPFRDVSKRLYSLLRSYSWNAKIERLGLDEVFLDVTDIVSYNVELLNRNSLPESYFCLSPSDPEVGFGFDATSFAGCIHGRDDGASDDNGLRMRLLLASHLAQYLRLKVEEEGYTAACGISTSKLLAKLVGDKNKPRNQTTLLALAQDDVLSFMDEHKLRKIPGIGGKITRVLERIVLGMEPDPNIYSMECFVTVGEVRTHPDISAASLERLLSGPGSEKGLGNRVWGLLHGVDDAEVKPARDVPSQISIEDTYKGLNTPDEVRRALLAVTASLLRRMHIDLLEGDDGPNEAAVARRKWLAYPRTIRLSTRPYTSPADNVPYNWGRASRSCPLPGFVFLGNSSGDPGLSSSSSSTEQTAERLVAETLLPLFHKLHPDRRGGWNIGLLNVCVTNMAGADGGVPSGRDIAAMFRRQEDALRPFTEVHGDGDGPTSPREHKEDADSGAGGAHPLDGRPWSSPGDEDGDEEEENDGSSFDTWACDTADQDQDLERCPLCDRLIPFFAVLAHERYHTMDEGA